MKRSWKGGMTALLLACAFVCFGAATSLAQYGGGMQCGRYRDGCFDTQGCYPLSGTCQNDAGVIVDFTSFVNTPSLVGTCVPGNESCTTPKILFCFTEFFVAAANGPCGTRVCTLTNNSNGC